MKTAAEEHATMAQSRELQRAKALDERRRMLDLVKRHGFRSPEEYNAAKVIEFLARERKV
jgi:hypothetical protein